MRSGPRWLLTGAIGSGKTAVRHILEDQGVNCIDSDAIGHSVLEPDGPAFKAVASTWPQVVRDGRVERGILADIVFSDRSQLKTLETLTHPHIFGIIERTLQGITSAVVVEVPLLKTELSGDWRRVVVDTADDVRRRRLIGRGMSSSDAGLRMAVQPSRSEWLGSADLVVPNHEGLDELTSTVMRVLPLIRGDEL